MSVVCHPKTFSLISCIQVIRLCFSLASSRRQADVLSEHDLIVICSSCVFCFVSVSFSSDTMTSRKKVLLKVIILGDSGWASALRSPARTREEMPQHCTPSLTRIFRLIRIWSSRWAEAGNPQCCAAERRQLMGMRILCLSGGLKANTHYTACQMSFVETFRCCHELRLK